MRAKRDSLVGLGVAVMLCWVGTAAGAPPTKAQTCEAAKLTAAGTKQGCLATERAKELKGQTFNYAKCDIAFTKAFTAAETKAGLGVCPTEGDAAAVEALIDAGFNHLQAALSGVRFVDNGDGTVADTDTGLMWQQKVTGSGCLHCVGDRYAWPNAMSEFISQINGFVPDDGTGLPGPQAGLAGHTDWRLPSIAELQTLLLLVPPCGNGTSPCIDPIFGPTAVDAYWSSSTYADSPNGAWRVFFGGGHVDNATKSDIIFVRAVRGGR